MRCDILSKVVFYQKILILEELSRYLHVRVDIGKIKSFNNVRNALVHGFPKNHKYFTYDKGHLVSDNKFNKLSNDVLSLCDDLEEVRKHFIRFFGKNR